MLLVIFFSQAITGNMRALELSCKRFIQRNQLHRNLLKTLTQSCQFAVVLDYWPISENSCGFSNNLCELCLIVLHPALEQWECYGRQSVLYVLLSKVPEHWLLLFYQTIPQFLVLFYLFYRVWVPLLHADSMICCCYVLDPKPLVLCRLISWSSINSTQVESYREICHFSWRHMF